MGFKEALESSGKTQGEISAETGLDRSTISQYLNTNKLATAKTETIISLSEALNCSPVDIMPGHFQAKTEWETYKKIKDLTIQEISKLFTQEEKKYMADMLNGSLYNKDTHPVEYLKLLIIDSDIYNGLGEKWQINSKELVKKVDKLSTFQAYMVADTISKWWNDEKRDIENIF